ncbi:GNAT family N-acetyltransferase [Methanomassiliicoccus luminyensis]|uniref:GNAT family N-acetyltransferase n=1 Tax=Methanomassiliicoccus luminyensis TaxID=1080712 RepID=UPI0003666760|nr:GNAT family protein [Methanomassiliicoccus luminyensis]
MLKGERVGLRPLQTEDVWLLYRWHNDERVTEGLGAQRPLFAASMEEEKRAAERMVSSIAERGYVILQLQDGKPIGWASLSRIDRRNGAADLQIVIGEPSCWGQGLGREAVRLVLDHAFMVLNLHRVQARVPEYNDRAVRCFEESGFRRDGTFRDDHFHHGEHCSTLLMSVLRGEHGGPG